MSRPDPKNRERHGNIPLSALLLRLRRDLERALRALDDNDPRLAKDWLEQALAIYNGKGIW